MEAPFLALLETARRVGRVAEECKLAVDVEEFVGSFRPDLMDVMAAWYRGAKFADVMKMTDVFEVIAPPWLSNNVHSPFTVWPCPSP